MNADNKSDIRRRRGGKGRSDVDEVSHHLNALVTEVTRAFDRLSGDQEQLQRLLAEGVDDAIGVAAVPAEVKRVLDRLSDAQKQMQQALAESVESVTRAATMTRFVPVLTDDPFVERTIRHAVERMPEIVHARRKELTESNIEALVDLYLADDPIAEARAAIEADNARERARFLSEVLCLTSRQVAEHAGHQAANTSMTASRWKQQRRVFSVPWQGSELYPAFQFRDGQPRPVVAKVLRELPDKLSPWQTAFWFTSSNGWLRGATPAERLDDEDAALAAARRESEPIVG